MLTSTTITQDLKAAMLKKDSATVSVLRLLLAALNNEKITQLRELTEAEIIAIFQKEVKKRQEAIELYQRGGRPELADKESQEIKIINSYLPELMAETEVKNIIQQMKDSGELGADFGQAMRAAMARFKGKADGKMVAEIVKQVL